MDFCIPEVKGQLDCDKTLRHKSSFLAVGPYNDFVSVVIFFPPPNNIHISGDAVHMKIFDLIPSGG